MKKGVIAAVLLAGVSACSPKADATRDTASAGASNPVIPKPNAATVTREQFRGLKWLEGYWRGAAPGGSPFYERYVFADDSSISMYVFPDSTFGAPNDSAQVTLRAGTLRDSGRTASWVASHIDSTRVDFAPEWGATNTFTWQKDGDSWTATIESGTGNSKTITVYRMRRAGR